MKINPTNNEVYATQLSLSELEKMDDASIWTKLDLDGSKTISDKEINLAGFVGEKFNKVKMYLLERFGKEKVTNVSEGKEYFDYNTWTEQPRKISSYEDIPIGSHLGVRDARNCDISSLQLSKELLLNLCIDKTTILSSEQKAIVDVYMEAAKNPGLGIRTLHEQGVTGKGVKMAIIDQPLGKHKEYANNIDELVDINVKSDFPAWQEASMHGAAVTSIAVGQSVGVAPDAKVDYYSAVNLSKNKEDIEAYRQNLIEKINSTEDLEYKKDLENKLQNIDPNRGVTSNLSYVEAINRVLDKNKTLPPKERVSVISISWGFDRLAPGYDELQKAIERAKEENVFIVSTALEEFYGMDSCGANRAPDGDLETPEAYEAGAFIKEYSESFPQELKDSQLLVPMDHRTVADFTDNSSYRYEGNDGGMSWSVPWLAGMYVLAKQVKPEITPQEFWDSAMQTSDACNNNDTGTYVARLINPQALIKKLQTE